MTDESNIIINGVALSQGESMTLRVALNNFNWDLGWDLGVGLGFKLREGYSAHTKKIQDYMHINQKGEVK
jgi:hypothetical protein